MFIQAVHINLRLLDGLLHFSFFKFDRTHAADAETHKPPDQQQQPDDRKRQEPLRPPEGRCNFYLEGRDPTAVGTIFRHHIEAVSARRQIGIIGEAPVGNTHPVVVDAVEPVEIIGLLGREKIQGGEFDAEKVFFIRHFERRMLYQQGINKNGFIKNPETRDFHFRKDGLFGFDRIGEKPDRFGACKREPFAVLQRIKLI